MPSPYVSLMVKLINAPGSPHTVNAPPVTSPLRSTEASLASSRVHDVSVGYLSGVMLTMTVLHVASSLSSSQSRGRDAACVVKGKGPQPEFSFATWIWIGTVVSNSQSVTRMGACVSRVSEGAANAQPSTSTVAVCASVSMPVTATVTSFTGSANDSPAPRRATNFVFDVDHLCTYTTLSNPTGSVAS